jgi:glycerol-3-phosphate cytidylyltransferase-like family protein
MSTNVFEGNGVIVLIDEENIRNKRVYINEQGNRCEVLCNLSIKNKTLIN